MVDVELFIHGVPAGESFWGENDDNNFLGKFYVKSTDDIKFLVQTRALNGKLYCYYSYLVYNVTGSDGRQGSYFGMSLRLDAYCKDFANLYRFLDLIFNTKIKDDILIYTQDRLKYRVTDFASVDSKLNNIQQELFNFIGSVFNNNSFIELKGFPVASGECPTTNFYDCTSENVMSVLRQCGKIAISPYYPSKNEKEIQRKCEEKLQNIQHQYDAILKEKESLIEKERGEINDRLSNANSQITSLKSEVEQKKQQISELQKKNTGLNSQIQSLVQNKRIADLVGQLKQPVNELAKSLNRLVPEPNSNHQNYYSNPSKTHTAHKPPRPKKDRLLLILIIVISVLICFAALFFWYTLGYKKTADSDVKASTEKVLSIQSEAIKDSDTCQILTKQPKSSKHLTMQLNNHKR